MESQSTPEDPLPLAAMRVGYGSGEGAAGADGVSANLDESWLTGDPPWLGLFGRWLREGVAAAIPEPNAMVIATVDAQGCPSTRTVLCKSVDANGLVFFTGHDSDKGRDLSANPCASVTFPWIALERQVHFRGLVERVSREVTQEYWASRPRGSQLGSAGSFQSQPIGSRDELEDQARRIAAQFGGVDGTEAVPVPDRWGGYLLRPRRVEFWQGRADRLHNRVRLTLDDGGWHTVRLQP
ncbi:pyridoxamine 5'-phosphate oxidase [Gordonia jinhuaensis]